MKNAAISSLLQFRPRYMRSTNVERDIDDRKALDHYVLTPHAQECLGRLAKPDAKPLRMTGIEGDALQHARIDIVAGSQAVASIKLQCQLVIGCILGEFVG